MHHPLPQAVREAVSLITQAVSHETAWGYWTQAGFPGECRWAVTGGHDWPLPALIEGTEVPLVSITAQRAGDGTTELKVEGLEKILSALAERRAIIEDPQDDDTLRAQNEISALEQVLVVLEAANTKKS